jgi:hypothetical protein
MRRKNVTNVLTKHSQGSSPLASEFLEPPSQMKYLLKILVFSHRSIDTSYSILSIVKKEEELCTFILG